MTWTEIEGDGLSAEEKEKKANFDNAKRRQDVVDMAKAYHRLFTSKNGQKVMTHLTNSFVINNATPLNAQNPTYESGFHGGESSVVQFIISQIQKATIL